MLGELFHISAIINVRKPGSINKYLFFYFRKYAIIDRIDTFYILYMIISIFYCTKRLPSEGAEYLLTQTRNGNTTNT